MRTDPQAWVRSRASLVEAALERELRRFAAVGDADTLRRVGPADDLDGLVEWSIGNIGVDEWYSSGEPSDISPKPKNASWRSLRYWRLTSTLRCLRSEE